MLASRSVSRSAFYATRCAHFPGARAADQWQQCPGGVPVRRDGRDRARIDRHAPRYALSGHAVPVLTVVFAQGAIQFVMSVIYMLIFVPKRALKQVMVTKWGAVVWNGLLSSS